MKKSETVAIVADHRGYDLKDFLLNSDFSGTVEWVDINSGIKDEDDDYPLLVKKLVKRMREDHIDKGIVICGSGAGVTVVANKFNGIRATLGLSPEQIRSAREHDAVNVLALAGDYQNPAEAEEMVQKFLTTAFKEEVRYRRRLEQIQTIEHEE